MATKPILHVIALTTAFAALILLLASGIGSHLGLWHFRAGFTLLKYSAWLGLAAALTGGAALAVSYRQRAWKAVIVSGVAVAIGVTSFAIPYCWKQTAGRVPKIHDISTDTVNPPLFVAVLPLRKDAPNPAEYGGVEIAAKQALAYPDLKPLPLSLPPEQAFGLALETAQRMGWRILAAVPTEGRIEASDTTFWFGFVDDIVIRVRPEGKGSLLDIRSVSRVGLSDVGTNAGRIRKFIARLKG
ncbi:MAG TPA: DUF1499 domain-containing protein [Dongiaceae bacterium]|nr:DUF1499 domain-containing protein [Dongiaceae bacterium]